MSAIPLLVDTLTPDEHRQLVRIAATLGTIWDPESESGRKALAAGRSLASRGLVWSPNGWEWHLTEAGQQAVKAAQQACRQCAKHGYCR
jgi:hypothetical protein